MKKKPNIPGIRGRIKAMMTEHMDGPGLYIMRVEHDDNCIATLTQNLDDCTCRDPWVKAPIKVEPDE